MQCKHRMTYEIAWSGQPQETRVVFSGITMLWEYLVFLYNSELFHFVLLTCLQFGWEPRLLLSNYIYEEIWDVLMRKSEMSNTQFRIFFFCWCLFPFPCHAPLVLVYLQVSSWELYVQSAFSLSLRTVFTTLWGQKKCISYAISLFPLNIGNKAV